MSDFVTRLYDFCVDTESNGFGIKVENKRLSSIQKYVEGKPSIDIALFFREQLFESHGIKTTDYHNKFFSLPNNQLQWARSELQAGDGLLRGGFSINGITDIFDYEVPFWEQPLKDFRFANQASLPSVNDYKDLRWFDSPSFYNDAFYTPQYGCVKLRKGNWPDTFVFFDSGFTYKLNINSFETYFDNLISSAAVTCWQYFFVDIEDLISKNKGVDYYSWSLKIDTELDEGLSRLAYKKSTQYDRLDLIMEYLERCIRLLPSSFPFIDFSYHIDFYERLNQKYLAQK